MSDNVLDERLCPSWTEPDGTRCIRLPGGIIWSRTEDELAEFALETMTDPKASERHLAIIARLTTRQERAQLEEMVRLLASSATQ